MLIGLFLLAVHFYLGFPGGASGKEPGCQCRSQKRLGFDPWVGKIPWMRAWQPTAVFLPGESHGQRSLEGCSPWGHTESDTTEVTEQARMCIFRWVRKGKKNSLYRKLPPTPVWATCLIISRYVCCRQRRVEGHCS